MRQIAKIPLRSGSEAVLQVCTGELKPPSDAAIPANVDHVLAIIFPACMGFRLQSEADQANQSLASIRQLNSIQFNSTRRDDASIIIFHFHAKRRHSCILLNVGW